VQRRLLDLLGADLIDAAYMCPNGPDAPSERRKPAPGMILEAVRDLGLDVSRSWFIGDKQIDVQCGRNAGVRSILVRTGHGQEEDAAGAHFVAKDIASAADFILSDSGAS
jgi:D-glycero-D-manno-heptose 1,7-bisphosphate phosphatase